MQRIILRTLSQLISNGESSRHLHKNSAMTRGNGREIQSQRAMKFQCTVLLPLSKRAAVECKHTESSPLRKTKTTSAAGKVMATVFWNSRSILCLYSFSRSEDYGFLGVFGLNDRMSILQSDPGLSLFPADAWLQTRAAEPDSDSGLGTRRSH